MIARSKICVLLSLILVTTNQGQTSDAIVQGDPYSNNRKSQENYSCEQLLDFKLEQIESLTQDGRIEDGFQSLKEAQPCTVVDSARVLSSYGALLLNAGKYREAIEQLKKAEVILATSLPNSIYITETMSRMASANLALGNYENAQRIEEAVLSISQKESGTNSEQYAASINNLGIIRLANDPIIAQKNFQEALELYSTLYPKNHPKLAIGYTNLGNSFLAMDSLIHAKENFNLALNIWSKKFPEGHPNSAMVLRNLSMVEAKNGNNEQALKYLEKGLSYYKQAFGDKHPELASTLNEIASIYLKEGDFDSGLQN